MGNTNTPFGMYRIEVNDEPVMLEGEAVSSYRITYENSPISIVVLVDKGKKCKNYIVVSDGLSIMYKCDGKYFGICPIDVKYEKDGCITNDKNIYKANYFHQKILSIGPQEEMGATSLIASYFPYLVK